MNTEIKKFHRFIKENGYRYTSGRKYILEAVLKRNDHFSVDDLYLDLHKKHPGLSQASIYRTIPLLVRADVIKEVLYGERHSFYECAYGQRHHEHMRCIECGKVIEFDDKEVHKFFKQIAQKYQFKMDIHLIEIKGICADCRRD